MTEACYYVGESTPKPSGLRSRPTACLKEIDEDLRLDLYYDYIPKRFYTNISLEHAPAVQLCGIILEKPSGVR